MPSKQRRPRGGKASLVFESYHWKLYSVVPPGTAADRFVVAAPTHYLLLPPLLGIDCIESQVPPKVSSQPLEQPMYVRIFLGAQLIPDTPDSLDGAFLFHAFRLPLTRGVCKPREA